MRKTPRGFKVYAGRNGQVWIGSTKTSLAAMKVFPDADSYYAWAAKASEDDWKSLKPTDPLDARRGPEVDYGHNVSAFTFGASVSDRARRRHRRAVSEAVADMARVWGAAPEKFLGDIAVGVRTPTKAIAVYYPNQDLVSIRTTVSGVLAHECCHRLEAKGLLDKVVNAHPWLKSGPVARRAARIVGYWRRPTEVLARCFEAVTAKLLDDEGSSNVYLVSLPDRGGITRQEIQDNWPYPDGDEEHAEAFGVIRELFQFGENR